MMVESRPPLNYVSILGSEVFGPLLALLSLGGQRARSARLLVSNALSACNALSAFPSSQVLLYKHHVFSMFLNKN